MNFLCEPPSGLLDPLYSTLYHLPTVTTVGQLHMRLPIINECRQRKKEKQENGRKTWPKNDDGRRRESMKS